MSFSATRAAKLALVSSASAFALSAEVASADPAAHIDALEELGAYLSGDKHNHTTCTDGAMSVQTVVNESIITYGLDWFAQTGHGGNSPRDCRFNDPEYDGAVSGEGDFWTNTIGNENIKGDERFSTGNGQGTFFGGPERRMWRWQELIEYAFPLQREMGVIADQPTWLGIEHNTPGHEHVDVAILGGKGGALPQLGELPEFGVQDSDKFTGDAYSTGQFNYLWDRGDQDDTSGGDEFDFENPDNNGVAKTFGDTTGTEGHEKSVRAVAWMNDNFGHPAYFVPAHVERQGGFVSDANRGYNVEHFRDYSNAGQLSAQDVRVANRGVPRRAERLGVFVSENQTIAFGAEMLAGHQFANGGRGTYEADRPTAGFGTYGGAGAYAGAEVSLPGKDFDGNDLTNATLTEVRDELNALFDNQFTEPSGSDAYDQLDACNDCADPAPEGIGTSPRERFVLGRPGLATMWDALLAEGRKFFIFGSSDWHNRGSFGPFEPQSTLDPWPGEYNKLYAFAFDGQEVEFKQTLAQGIVDGMRLGNTWSVFGDLIDEFFMTACQDGFCVTMGQTLLVDPEGGDIEMRVELRDPEGINFAPYTFPNQSLAQIGVDVPMNEPVLAHMDVIKGDMIEGGLIDPADPAYTEFNANPTVELFARVFNPLSDESGATTFSVDGDRLVFEWTVPVADIPEAGMYMRTRGTNMHVATPNETDADGNPLLDDFALLIPCTVEPEPAFDVVEINPGFSPFFTARGATGRNTVDGPVAGGAQFDPSVCPDHLPVDENGVKRLDADVEAWTDLWFYASPIWLVPSDANRVTENRRRDAL